MSERNGEGAVLVPGYQSDGAMAIMERLIKRLWIVVIVLIVALVGTNLSWIIYESQFATETTTIEQQIDTGEAPAVVSGTGDATYGEDYSKGDSSQASREDKPGE